MGCRLNGIGYYVGRFIYQPRVWDDIRVPLNDTVLGGANDPQFIKFTDNGAGSQGVYSYYFSNLAEQELFFSAQIPHGWEEETSIIPHIHWSPENSASGNVVWGLEYTVSTIVGVFPTTTILTASPASTTSTAHAHLVTDIGTIPMTGNLISTVLICRIFRSVGGLDTYGARAVGHEVDFHFQKNTPGSRDPYVK